MLNKKITLAILYFTFSTFITWWFIQTSPLYTSMQQKLLSCSIAGAKWGIQIFAAWLFLEEKKWHFIKNIAITCFTGSLILLPYAILSTGYGINNKDFFLSSLLFAVAVMILLYAMSVRNARVKIYWWLGWLACLSIAVSLQLTIVFHVL